LKSNVEALALELTDEEIDQIEGAYPFEIGFPMNMLFEWRGTGKYKTSSTAKDIGLLRTAVNLDAVDWPKVGSLVISKLTERPADLVMIFSRSNLIRFEICMLLTYNCSTIHIYMDSKPNGRVEKSSVIFP